MAPVESPLDSLEPALPVGVLDAEPIGDEPVAVLETTELDAL
jgi:hypothetical protein